MDIKIDKEEIIKESVKNCQKEIGEILNKYELALKPILITTQEGIVPTVVLIPAESSQEGDKADTAREPRVSKGE